MLSLLECFGFLCTAFIHKTFLLVFPDFADHLVVEVFDDMKVIVTSENGSTKQTYTLAKAYLSTNKTVTTSTNEGANVGSNAVDGNQSTRWAASSGSYPQHLIVDLGGTFVLDSMDISWYTSGTRSYKYKVYVADESGVYNLVLDKTSNTTAGLVKHDLNGVVGRYVKIEVTGVSDGSGYASIYELVVSGWGINSKVYEVKDNQIIINTNSTEIAVNEFLKDLKCEGDYDLTISNGGRETVRDGDVVNIVDSKGQTHTYTVVFK